MSIDIFDLAPRGRWEGSQLVGRHGGRDHSRLPFNGGAGDDRGFVIDSRSRLEDGSTQRVLRTHPKWVANGAIKGWLPWATLPDNAVFEAQVGFLDGAAGTDGVEFQVWAHRIIEGRQRWTRVARVSKGYTGRLATIRADLTHLSNQRVSLELRVDAGRSAGRDWAAWVAPRVVSSTEPGSMPVTVELKRFTIHNADEDDFWSNGDEPYLLPMSIFADGHTVRFDALDRARVRIYSPRKTHENLTSGHLRGGGSIVIPETTGLVQTSMKPVSGLPLTLGKSLAMAGLAVIGMEEDATPTAAIDAGRRTMVRETKRELEGLIRSMRRPDAAAIQELTGRVQRSVLDTIKNETLSSFIGVLSIADPDDYIDSNFETWTYAQIQDAGPDTIPFTWDFKKSGVAYTLEGVVYNG